MGMSTCPITLTPPVATTLVAINLSQTVTEKDFFALLTHTTSLLLFPDVHTNMQRFKQLFL